MKPLSKSYHDWYGEPLLMTPVDAFDTMILMGLKEESAEAKKLILEKLSFDKDLKIQNFEIVIRLLGGLISAYEWDGDKAFLKLATDLADRLLPVFNSPTGMPYVHVNLKTGAVSGSVSNPAEIGTLLLEFGTMSKLTGNPVYYEKAKKAMMALVERTSEIGLIGSAINVETGKWENGECSLSGGIDSYYEYLYKCAIYFNDKEMKTAWDKAVKSINKNLEDTKHGGLWYAHVDMNTGKLIRTQFGALDAFWSSVLALSGDVKRAKALQENNFKMWTENGVEPEQYNYSEKKILSPEYILRPENIESAYYLYKITKEEKYLKMGVEYYNSLVKYCKYETGYTHLKSVVTKERSDSMESFFFAETLKYLYLIFAPDNVLNFNSVVFNTEAHPFKKHMVK